MDEQTLRDQIRKLISRNKTEDAFELLSSIQFSKVDKQLIVLNSQYNRIKEELRLNVISKDEGERRINQINFALLDISNKMKTSKPITTGYENLPPIKQTFNPKMLLLLLIPLAAILLFWGMGRNSNTFSDSSQDPIETDALHFSANDKGNEQKATEAARIAAANAEKERLKIEDNLRKATEAAKTAAANAEKERLENEDNLRKATEAAKIAAANAEKERLESERNLRKATEAARIAVAKTEKERLENERLLQKATETARIAAAKAEKERLEKERLLQEAKEADRIAAVKAEKERLKKEREKQTLSWKPKGSKGAVVGGREAGNDLIVCRCNYKGAKQPGKVNVGECHFGWGGREIHLKDFEILTNPGAAIEKWTRVSNNQIPAGAVVAGYENRKPVYVGRAKQNGVYHPGKVFLAEGTYICNFGYGGKEITKKVNLEVLVSGH